MAKKIALSLGLGFILSSSAFASSSEVESLQRALLNMQNEMQVLQQQLASANGEIEQLSYDLKNAQKENNSLKEQLKNLNTQPAALKEDNLKDQGSASELVGDESGGADNLAKLTENVQAGHILPEKKENLAKNEISKLKTADEKAQREYTGAYDLVINNQLEFAEKAFKHYINTFEENSLTPNAWYWLGQVQYKQQKLDDARVSFLNSAKYKESGKRPDALYKLGLISEALGDREKARKFFELVIKTYPEDTSAKLAREKLSSK